MFISESNIIYIRDYQLYDDNMIDTRQSLQVKAIVLLQVLDLSAMLISVKLAWIKLSVINWLGSRLLHKFFYINMKWMRAVQVKLPLMFLY